MAQLEETEEIHNSTEEAGKPKSQTSTRSRAEPKKVVEESEQSEEGNDKPEGDGGEEQEEGEEDDEEYEIEGILDAKRGMFKKNEMAYMVKWKGYGPEQNSWVAESDAGNAKDLITEFLKARARAKEQNSKPAARGRKPTSGKISKGANGGTPDTEGVSVSTTKRGRGKAASPSDDEDEGPRRSKKSRVNTSANGSASAKRGTLASLNRTDDEDGSVADANGTIEERPYTTMKDLKLASYKSWEEHVKKISTVERHKNGLMIFFETTDGKYVREPSSICAKKFPQKLIQFYEAHLRWKAQDDDGATLL